MCTSDNNSTLVLLEGKLKVDLAPYRSYVNHRLMKAYPHMVHNPWVYHAESNRYLFEQGAKNVDLSKYDLIHAQDVICAVALSRLKPVNVPLVTSIHGFVGRHLPSVQIGESEYAG